MSPLRRALLTLIGLLAIPLFCSAAELEYEVKAEYLERFTRFIDWPADSLSKTFHLCVIGSNPFGSYLQDMTAQVKFKGNPAEINQLRDPGHAKDCNLLFIAKSEASKLQQILKITSDLPILTVSDSPGFAEQGVLINFHNEDGKIRFEINNDAMKRSRLHVSSRLLGLARLVKGAAQ
jgi:uncharacterized protein DUF4154